MQLKPKTAGGTIVREEDISIKHIKLTSQFYTAVISLYKNDNKHCRQARPSKDIWNITNCVFPQQK